MYHEDGRRLRLEGASRDWEPSEVVASLLLCVVVTLGVKAMKTLRLAASLPAKDRKLSLFSFGNRAGKAEAREAREAAEVDKVFAAIHRSDKFTAEAAHRLFAGIKRTK